MSQLSKHILKTNISKINKTLYTRYSSKQDTTIVKTPNDLEANRDGGNLGGRMVF